MLTLYKRMGGVISYFKFLFLPLTFIFSGCAAFQSSDEGSVSFVITREMAQKISSASSARSASFSEIPEELLENSYIGIELKDGYTEIKTVPVVEGASITFEGIPVGTSLYAEAIAYRINGNGGTEVVYGGVSNKITVQSGENILNLTMKETYEISFVLNDGEIKSNFMTFYIKGIGTALPTANDVVRNGYTFAGWYETENFSTSAVSKITSEETGDKIYYARWLVEEKFVKVTGATISGAVDGSSVFIEGRTVTIPNMYVSDHEVTQGEYETYCKCDVASTDGYTVGANYPIAAKWYDTIVYCNLRSIDEGLTPVYTINGSTDPTSWSGILEENGKYSGPKSVNSAWNSVICDFTANGYRLPTEAEWEYIARGGNGGIPAQQCVYAGSDTIDSVAWYNGNAESMQHEVKTLAPNSLGIYDMSGNVSEWCWDWSSSVSTDRTLRGGGFSSTAEVCTVYKHSNYNPKEAWPGFGFRVVRNAN